MGGGANSNLVGMIYLVEIGLTNLSKSGEPYSPPPPGSSVPTGLFSFVCPAFILQVRTKTLFYYLSTRVWEFQLAIQICPFYFRYISSFFFIPRLIYFSLHFLSQRLNHLDWAISLTKWFFWANLEYNRWPRFLLLCTT